MRSRARALERPHAPRARSLHPSPNLPHACHASRAPLARDAGLARRHDHDTGPRTLAGPQVERHWRAREGRGQLLVKTGRARDAGLARRQDQDTGPCTFSRPPSLEARRRAHLHARSVTQVKTCSWQRARTGRVTARCAGGTARILSRQSRTVRCRDAGNRFAAPVVLWRGEDSLSTKGLTHGFFAWASPGQRRRVYTPARLEFGECADGGALPARVLRHLLLED